jgi:hypothetical protein
VKDVDPSRDGNRWPILQMGEVNTPGLMDATERFLLYDGFILAGILAWTNRMSE